MISRPHVVPYPISNHYIIVKFDGVNGGVKTGLRQKMIFQLSVRELHIDILKKDAAGFSMAFSEKDFSLLAIYTFNYFLHHN